VVYIVGSLFFLAGSILAFLDRVKRAPSGATLPPGTLTPVFAWHFVANNRKLAHSGEPLELNRTYRVAGEIVPCQNGLHGSLRLIDALQYAPGSILTCCSYGGTIEYEADKLAASERTVLWIGDIEPILHEAACHFAENALRVAKVTDPRSWAVIEAKRAWLRGEITDKELAAARAAAWDAARNAVSAAARNAARAAASDAAWDAARKAASDAASAAAWAAASDAVSAAARNAASDAQNEYLEAAVREFAGVDQSTTAAIVAAKARKPHA
jgi:hypothetical protein